MAAMNNNATVDLSSGILNLKKSINGTSATDMQTDLNKVNQIVNGNLNDNLTSNPQSLTYSTNNNNNPSDIISQINSMRDTISTGICGYRLGGVSPVALATDLTLYTDDKCYWQT